MNYNSIHNVLIFSRHISSVIKNRQFYKYLLDNNVAYYYSQYISTKKNKYEKSIISAGEVLNNKYKNTVRLLKEICEKEKIDFLLFKTFKHIPEVVDGDIDIFIKEIDFSLFLVALEKRGFTCALEGTKKASCYKRGYSTIEPRTTISFHGNLIISESDIWKNTKEVVIDNMRLISTTEEIDIIFMFLNMFYGPNYIRLYTYLVFRKIDPKSLYDLVKNQEAAKDLNCSLEILSSSDILKRRFPVFPDNITFIKWWLKKIFMNSYVPFFIKIKHLLFFYYAKYGYVFLGRLPFRHDWKLTYE